MFGDKKVKTQYSVVESDGVVGGVYPVERVKGYTDGLVLVYKRGETVERVYVGLKYRPLRVDGEFWVGKRIGNDSAAKLVECGEDGRVMEGVDVVGLSSDADCPGEDLSQLVNCDILGVGMKAVKKKSNMLWIIIGIAVVVVVAVVAIVVKQQGG